ncbi:Bis(5'-adenosyl)-triphosphatase ENPP4 [Acropora cervicornis]|uniref:Bis(5'-adenosyl)-triphosphatase ENPP4 n=1 Tax=Acropora cervicornis TaxID=6130 RepID=A0AAD9V8U3_ACRCE|nr:Bis(5'-adenosyl)-triphosphatase ENPP4 [Acropora cervicornis]
MICFGCLDFLNETSNRTLENRSWAHPCSVRSHLERHRPRTSPTCSGGFKEAVKPNSFFTGLYPESHGIVSNRFWDPVYQEEFIYEYDCANFDPKFYNDSEPIWPTLQRSKVNKTRSGVYFWPGFGSKDEEFLKRVDRIIGWLKSDDPPLHFISTILNGKDIQMERFRQLTRFPLRRLMKMLLDQLEKEKFIYEVNLIFVSDHSMKEQKPEDYHWKHNRRIRPIFVQPDVGWTVTKSNATATPGKWIYGSHGWPPKDAKTYSIFFAQGPVFKVSYKIEPFSILDLYPMMCDLLRIEPRPHNSTMETEKCTNKKRLRQQKPNLAAIGKLLTDRTVLKNHKLVLFTSTDLIEDLLDQRLLEQSEPNLSAGLEWMKSGWTVQSVLRIVD